MATTKAPELVILDEIRKVSIAVAVIDERLKGHFSIVQSIQTDLHETKTKLEETSDVVNRHQFLFKISAWLLTLLVSCFSVKTYLKL